MHADIIKEQRMIFRNSTTFCTALILYSRMGSFCPIFFDIFLHNPPPPHFYLQCSKCTSVSHLSCIPDVASSSQGYLCPPCSNPNFTFFFATPNHDNAIEINVHLAKQLVVTATIVSESIHNVADIARINAENRVKEALLAKDEVAEYWERIRCRKQGSETEMVRTCEEEMHEWC
ncbi:hypothetical protein P3S68_032886 [Capsicum galapagoense]